jgi:hypothetical protein
MAVDMLVFDQFRGDPGEEERSIYGLQFRRMVVHTGLRP